MKKILIDSEAAKNSTTTHRKWPVKKERGNVPDPDVSESLPLLGSDQYFLRFSSRASNITVPFTCRGKTTHTRHIIRTWFYIQGIRVLDNP